MAEEEVSSSAKEKGVFDFSDGGRYIGEWNDDGANGYGVCVGPSDSGVFQGKWANGNQTSGVFRWSNGQQYMGTWRDGMRHGLGKEVRPDSSEFSGDFTENVRGPFGVLKLSNGALYRGTWEAGLQDGVGVELYGDKGVYKGQYKKGLRNGYGTRSSAEYEASEKKHKESNKAGMESSLESFLVDRKSSRTTNPLLTTEEWNTLAKNEKGSPDLPKILKKNFHSVSTVNEIPLESNVQIYEGQWSKDKRHGHGVLRVPGMYMYCGEWSGNSRTGNGILVYEDGRREEGVWERGRLVAPLKRKKLSIKYHQLEAKVKQAHTLALQAADAARTKAILAVSRASAATNRAKLGMTAAETAKKDSETAKEKAVVLENLEHQKKEATTPTVAGGMEFPNVRHTPLDHVDSPSLLSVPSISPTPSYENLREILTTSKSFDGDLNRTENSSPLERHVSSMSVYSDTGIKMKLDKAKDPVEPKSNDPLSQTEVNSNNLALEPEKLRKRNLEKQMPAQMQSSFSDTSLSSKDQPEVGGVKQRRSSTSQIDKSTGEVVTVYPETIEESEQDSRSGTPTKATKMAYSQKEQVMSIDILKQMANWNKTIAYINFILLLFLLLLIVFMVAFLSTTISHNNPTNFMNPMA